jgi:hypothetical protein
MPRERALLLHALIIERIEFNVAALLNALSHMFHFPQDEAFDLIKTEVTLYVMFKTQEYVLSRLPYGDAVSLLAEFNRSIGKTPREIEKLIEGFHEDVLPPHERELTVYLKKEVVERAKQIHGRDPEIGVPERVLVHYLKKDLKITNDEPRMYVLAGMLKPDIEETIEECIGDQFYDWELRNGAWHNKKEELPM